MLYWKNIRTWKNSLMHPCLLKLFVHLLYRSKSKEYYIECRKNLYIRRKKECYSLAEQRDKARSEDRAAWKPKGHLGDTQTQSVDKISFLLKLSKFQFWLSFLCLIFSVCYLQWLTWPSTRSQWPGWRSFRRQPSLPAPVQTGLSGRLNLNLDRTQKQTWIISMSISCFAETLPVGLKKKSNLFVGF